MPRKMTIVFHDEELYTELKVLAVRQRRAASDIVAEAVREWMESREDEALLPLVQAREDEHKKKGGRPWSEVEREWDRSVSQRESPPVIADKKNVQG
jgi:hypothetical protein